MGFHPVNQAVRFLLELAALLAMGYWGWTQHTGLLRFLLAIGTPGVAAVSWHTFAVPNDRSRSGVAPVPVPGWVRLVLESAVFASGALALCDAGQALLGLIVAAVAVVHYALSFDRIAWLLRQRPA